MNDTLYFHIDTKVHPFVYDMEQIWRTTKPEFVEVQVMNVCTSMVDDLGGTDRLATFMYGEKKQHILLLIRYTLIYVHRTSNDFSEFVLSMNEVLKDNE